MFVDDLEMLMDLLGYDHIQAIQREILKPIFTAGADTDLPNPLPPVSATARPKETVITAEDYGEPSDGDEDEGPHRRLPCSCVVIAPSWPS